MGKVHLTYDESKAFVECARGGGERPMTHPKAVELEQCFYGKVHFLSRVTIGSLLPFMAK